MIHTIYTIVIITAISAICHPDTTGGIAYAQADSTHPTVLSIEPLWPGTNKTLTSPTNQTEIVFRITFSETMNWRTIENSIARSDGAEKGDITPKANHTTYLVPLSGLEEFRFCDRATLIRRLRSCTDGSARWKGVGSCGQPDLQ